jgi:hypothetical protein
MNRNHHKVRWLRRFAAVTLALWFVAQFVCAMHCASGNPQAFAVGGTLSHSCCHKDGKGPIHNDSKANACMVFKATLSSDVGAVANSVAHWEPLLTLVIAELPDSKSLSICSYLREARQPIACIVQEVSLGKAARSHAPPLLS